MNKPSYRAIIISPHLDDAVFSCCGRISELLKEGPVLVLNIFTGYLAEIKVHGVSLSKERYEEETLAAEFLGFQSKNLGELDATFRRKAYQNLGNLFRPPNQEDLEWLAKLRAKVFKLLSKYNFQELYVPLGVGWHVDHVLTFLIFEAWDPSQSLIYYEEAPYCLIPHATRFRLNQISSYQINQEDLTLVPKSTFQTWLKISNYYDQTAMMRNLKPFIFRQLAKPIVRIYFYRLLRLYEKLNPKKRNFTFNSYSIEVDLEQKINAMSIYKTQFKEFFSSHQDVHKALLQYSLHIQRELPASRAIERYWFKSKT